MNNLQALELRRLPEEYRGPLHGLPISVKECYFVKGCDATAGLVRYTNSPAQEDGAMIKVHQPTPWLTRIRFTRIRFTRISLTRIFKKFPFLT